MVDNDNISKLYNAMAKSGYDVADLGGSEDNFREAMKSPETRKAFYDWAAKNEKNGFRIGGYDEYESRLKAAYLQPQQPAAQRMYEAPSVYAAQNDYSQPTQAQRNYEERGEFAPIGQSTVKLNEREVPVLVGEDGEWRVPSPVMLDKDEEVLRHGNPSEAEVKEYNDKQERKYDADLVESAEKLHKNISQLGEEQRRSDIAMHNKYKEEQTTGGFIKDAILGIPAAEVPSVQGMIPSSQLDISPEGVHSKEQNASLTAAGRRWNATKAMLDAAKSGDFESGFYEGLFNIDTWDAKQMLLDNIEITRVVNKWEKEGEAALTKNEMALLDALALQSAVAARYEDELSVGYSAGKMVGEMAPFMLEIYVNPLSGLAKKSANKVAAYALKKYGKTLGKSAAKRMALTTTAKVVGAVPGAVAGGTGMALTTGLPAVGADVQSRVTGNAQYELKDGNIEYAGHTDQEGLGEAVYKGVTSRMLDNATEMLGAGYANAPFKWLAKAGKGTKLLGWMDNLANSKFGKAVNEFAEKTNWHGPIEEFLEEVHMGLADPVLVGDHTWGEFFTKKNLGTIAIGVAVPGVAMSTLKTIGGAAEGAFKAGAAERMKMLNADAAAMQLWEKPEEWEDLKRSLIVGSLEDIDSKLSEVYNDKALTPEQKTRAIEYAIYNLQYRTARGVADAMSEGRMSGIDNMLHDVYGTAYAERVSPARANESYKAWENAGKEVTAILGLKDQSVEDWLGGRTVEDAAQGNQKLLDALTAYETAKADFEGRRDRYQQDLQRAYSESDKAIDSKANNGVVYTTQLDGQTVNITGGNVVLNDNGTVDYENSSAGLYLTMSDGSVRVIASENIPGEVLAESAEELKAAERAKIDNMWKVEFDAVEVAEVPQTATVTIAGAQPTQTAQPVAATANNFTIEENGEMNSVEVLDESGEMARVLINGQEIEMPHEWLADARAAAGVEAKPVSSEAVTEEQPVEMAEQETVQAATPATALERIPKDEQGNPIYEQVDNDTAWDAIVEQTEGDVEMAQTVADGMVADKEAALKKLEKAKSKGGATIAEKIAAEKERKAAIDAAKADLAKWQEIAGVAASRRAAVVAPVEEVQPVNEMQPVEVSVPKEEMKTENGNENDIKEPTSVREELDNGDMSITNYNSRGEVETVAIERDGKIVAVDSYDEGKLFETTVYDDNGKASLVTRYDKNGDVVSVDEYEDGKRAVNEQKTAKSKSDLKNGLEKDSQVDSQVEEGGLKPITAPAEVTDVETADEFVAGLLGGIKITPESFRNETGLGIDEQRKLIGVIAGEDKGGVSVERASEIIAESYGEELAARGFHGDQQEIRDMLIDILSSGNPRSYVKRSKERRVAEWVEQATAEADAWAQSYGFASYDDMLAYEEQLLPSIKERFKDFDEQTYWAILAENYEEYDTRRESERVGNGSEVLQGERSVPSPRTENIGERNEGTEVRHDVQGGDKTADAQGENLGSDLGKAPQVEEEASNESTMSQESEQVSDQDRGIVDAETLQLNMSEEDFNALLNSGDKSAISGYLTEIDNALRIDESSPFAGQKALREEYKSAVLQYGKENIPAEVMSDLEKRMQPYSDLSRAIYDRKYALEDKLRELESAAEKATAAKEKEIKVENKNTAFGGFLADKTDLGASTAEKALNKKYNFDGKVMTVAEFVEDAVANGDAKLSAIEEPKYKGASRAAWNRMDAREQEADAKKVKESGTKTVYTVNDHNLGKTAYDYAKFLLGKNNPAFERATKTTMDALELRANELAERIGVKVTVAHSIDEVANEEAREALEAGRKIAGWYEKGTGEVVIYLPNNKSEKEVDMTFIHEVVAHHGLEKMLGKEKFAQFLDGVWEMMPKEMQDRFSNYGNNARIEDETKRRRAAADEYVAYLAEKMELTELEQGIWDRIVQAIQQALEAMGFKGLTQENVENLIKASYANLAKGATAQTAEGESSAASREQVETPTEKNSTDEVAPAKIEDVGEKIGGAKKDVFAENVQRMKADMEESDESLMDRIAKLPVSKVFNFDLQKLRDGGMPNEVISFIRIVKESVPAKPRTPYKVRRWVNNTLALYKLCLEAGTKWDKLQAFLNSPQFKDSDIKQLFDAYMAVGGFDSGLNVGKAKMRQLDKTSGTYVNGEFKTFDGKWYVRDAGKFGGIYDTREKAVEALKSFAGENAEPKDKKKEIKFAVYGRKDGSMFIAINGKSNIIIQDGFTSSKDAFAYISENNAELQERYRNLLDKSNADFKENRERRGRDYRAGKDVSAEEFRDTFGFRGVEFGNWMKQEDRRKALNECYDALMDLAAVCNVSPRALSLNGTLGMAFGSRGGGKFSAHYEPGKVVINLTKTMGAGSLAHEWFHALDNYFAKMGKNDVSIYATAGEGLRPEGVRKIGDNFYDKQGRKISEEEFQAIEHNVRAEMAAAWEHLMKSLKASDYYKRSYAYASLHNSDYWKRPTELGARAFSVWVENELSKQNASNDYLANNPRFVLAEASGTQRSFMPYPFDTDAEWMDEAFGNLFEVMQEKETESGKMALFREVEDLKQSLRDILVPYAKEMREQETRFRFIGEKGAANLDKAEEANIRLDNLNVAREMEEAEKDAKTIKLATGWERGADDKWRYEVMDMVDVDAVENLAREARSQSILAPALKTNLSSILKSNDSLLKAYPQLSNIAVVFRPMKAYNGYYDAKTNTLAISTSVLNKESEASEALDKAKTLLENWESMDDARKEFTKQLGIDYNAELEKLKNNVLDLEKAQSEVSSLIANELNETVAHEIQHAVQYVEGFAKGGDTGLDNPARVKQKAKNIAFMQQKLDESIEQRDALLKQRDELNDKMSAWYDAYGDAEFDAEMLEYGRQYDELEKEIDEADKRVEFNRNWLEATENADTKLGVRGYRSLAGEVESRNVQSRLGMTEEERRNSLAAETEDVAREDQIFLYDNLGVSEMAARLSSSNASALKYDKANGTNVKEFFDFLRGGKVFEKGKPNVFHIANAGTQLEQYGIKGKFIVGQFTFSRTHTNNEDHNLGVKEWADVINNLNTPLAITSYKGLPNEYRIYTYAEINGKNICVGVNVSLKDNEIALSNIISAYGRDINNLLGKESVNLLYPGIEELKRRISQVSTAHNSLLNATSTASADKDSNKSSNEQENGTLFAERNVGGNSGYVGYSMSKRAAEAREEGRFPKTDFKKEYGLTEETFNALVDAGIISSGEWHHTSKFGNKTPFYGWAEDGFAEFYANNKNEVDALAKDVVKNIDDAKARQDEFLRGWKGYQYPDSFDWAAYGRRARVLEDAPDRMEILRSEFPETLEAERHDNVQREFSKKIQKEIAEQRARIKVVFDEWKAQQGETRFSERVDDIPTRPMTLMERVKASLIEASAKNRENLKLRRDALRNLGQDLANVLKLMKAQKTYDKSTVETLMAIAKMYFKDAQLLDKLSVYEVTRIMGVLKRSVGKQNIESEAMKLMDILLDAHNKALAEVLEKTEKVKAKKVNAAGVEVMGRLDKYGQELVEAYREAKDLSSEHLDERIAESSNNLAEADENVRAALGLTEADDVDAVVKDFDSTEKAMSDAVDAYMRERARYEGFVLAKEYRDGVLECKAGIAELKRDIENAKSEFKQGRMNGKALNEFTKAAQEAILELKAEMAEGYHSVIGALAHDVRESSLRAKAFVQAQIDRAQEIQHDANSDMQGRNTDVQGTHPDKWNNSAVRAVMSAMPTFQTMLKKFGEQAVDGKGFLYNRFMPQVTMAADNEFRGRVAAREAIEAKLKDIYGDKKMDIGRFMDLSRKDGVSVMYIEGKEMKEFKLTKGQMLYIYMADKMADGEMKLRKMGITEDAVIEIAKNLDEQMIQFADWVQGEFLTDLRTKYNAVHERMFGAPMAAIENYFPLKIKKEARGEKGDVSQQNSEDKPSTVTGSIIKRTKNTTALDLSADAMSVLLEHIDNMEHWAAFAEFNRDLNTLLNYRRFQNQVKNMTTLRYGSGDVLWRNFKDVAAVAAGEFRPTKSELDKALLNIAKGITAAKINFRFYTAAKQILSAPAFWTGAAPQYFAKCYTNPKGSWKWAIDNLPGFKERWESRATGNEKLLEDESDWKVWRNKFVAGATRWGMSANAAVDALTVAMGARAVYLDKYNELKKAGYSEQKADEKARQAAAEAYNESQQSSESAYLSPLQKSGTVASAVFTTYMNSNFGFTRKTAQAIANIIHKTKSDKEKTIAFTAKQMARDGLTPAQAKAYATKLYNRSLWKDYADVALFGFGLHLIWELGGVAIYLVGGDDDDKKDAMTQEAATRAAMGTLQGLPLGEIAANAVMAVMAGDAGKFRLPELVAVGDIRNVAQAMDTDAVRGATEVVNMLTSIGIGVTPQVLTDILVACNELGKSPEEFGIFLLRFMNAPQSQLEALTIDKAMEEFAKNSAEVGKEYAEYRMDKNVPYFQWLYSDEGEQKAIERYAKRFDKLLNERLEFVVEDATAYDTFYNSTNPEMKKTLSEKRQGYLAGDEAAEFVKRDTKAIVEEVLYGKREINTVYFEMSTAEDEDMEFLIKKARKELEGKADATVAQKSLLKSINSNNNAINKLKRAMQTDPTNKVKYMNSIRAIRIELVDLINNSNE